MAPTPSPPRASRTSSTPPSTTGPIPAKNSRAIADDAAASIARHWEGYLDETNSAAIEYIEENAEREGIELQHYR